MVVFRREGILPKTARATLHHIASQGCIHSHISSSHITTLTVDLRVCHSDGEVVAAIGGNSVARLLRLVVQWLAIDDLVCLRVKRDVGEKGYAGVGVWGVGGCVLFVRECVKTDQEREREREKRQGRK